MGNLNGKWKKERRECITLRIYVMFDEFENVSVALHWSTLWRCYKCCRYTLEIKKTKVRKKREKMLCGTYSFIMLVRSRTKTTLARYHSNARSYM